ncbi:MAG: YggS family pyridoxal phosphate-dependent enzyme [Cellvibrionaceae bacterium]|nr:YggS family pyridoxal phosphate-dependent enzyme [Cellvibrionaceae bacterium]
MSTLQQRLSQVQQRIHEVTVNFERKPDSVQLLAVSKTQSAETIRAAFALGQEAFGENYVQEAQEKQQVLADLAIEWHFIGPIQSNKTRFIAEHFTWVHTVDRVKIAERLSRQRPQEQGPINICLQVNLDQETTKSGIVDQHNLIEVAQATIALPNLTLRGLMAIPAFRQGFDEQLACFKQLREALHQLQQRWPQADTLSMGMSADMKAAIAAGATIVRVGTGIFGARNQPANERK